MNYHRHGEFHSEPQLLVAPRPEEGESLLGYLLRLVEANQYQSLDWLFRLVRRKRFELDWNACSTLSLEEMSRLSKLCAQDINDLSRLSIPFVTLPNGEERWRFGDWDVPRWLYRLGRLRVCSSCLRDSAICRKWWDVGCVTSCPIHREHMFSHCPNCQLRIGWGRDRIVFCRRCKYDWRRWESKTVESDEDLDVSLYCQEMCSGSLASVQVRAEARSNQALRMDPPEFFISLFYVCGLLDASIDTAGYRLLGALSVEHIHRALQEALAIFDDWPTRFFELLARTTARARQENRMGLYREVREIRRVFGSRSFSEASTLRQALVTFAFEHWEGKHVGRYTLLRDVAERSRFVSAKWARDKLGYRIWKHHHGNKKPAGFAGGTETWAMIERDGVLVALERRNDAIHVYEARHLLGLTRQRVLNLIDGQLLHVRPKSPSHMRRALSRREIADFLERLKANCKVSPPPKKKMSFFYATRFAEPLKIAPHQIVRAMLDGNLPFYCRKGEVNFKGIAVGSVEFTTWLATTKAEGGKPWLTLYEARRYLKIDNHLLFRLRKSGLLGPRGRAPMISPQHLEDFERQYVFVREIAIGSLACDVLLHLKALNIPFTIFPKHDCRFAFFDRRDLDRVLKFLKNDPITSAPRRSKVKLASKVL